jgi:hypothetical protein
MNPKRRKNIYYYSLAEYYFARKMYKHALLNFHKIKNDDFILKVDMRNQMLTANYELHNYETALSMVDSYYHFLSHDETLSPTQKKLYKNFVKTVHLLILYNTSSDKSSLTEIEMHIKKDIPFREWVYEKVTELNNGNRTNGFMKSNYGKNIYSNQVKAS